MTSKKVRQIPPGTLFEYRLARLRFTQGYFVRRSIDVWQTGLEGNKLAELDCLAVSFDPQLNRSLEVVECKTGAGSQGEIDRLTWLKGIGAFTQAHSVTFAKLHVSERTRVFARDLGVNVLDEASIASAEQALNIDPKWWPGFHNPDFGESFVNPARAALTSSQELRRLGKYLYGSFWFADDFTRIKQLHTLFRLLVQNREGLRSPTLGLGLAEGTTLFTLATLSIAAWRNQLVEDEFRQLAETELSTGLGDRRSLRLLLRQIDSLQREQIEGLHTAYQAAGAGRLVFPLKSLETEILTPPEWIGAFINLVSRVAAHAHLATDILRWVDLWAAERFGAPQGLTMRGLDGLEDLGGRTQHLQGALELVQAFLIRHWDVPAELFERISPKPTADLATETKMQKLTGLASAVDNSSASSDIPANEDKTKEGEH